MWHSRFRRLTFIDSDVHHKCMYLREHSLCSLCLWQCKYECVISVFLGCVCRVARGRVDGRWRASWAVLKSATCSTREASAYLIVTERDSTRKNRWMALPAVSSLLFFNTHTCRHANRLTACLNTSKESSQTHPTHPHMHNPPFLCSAGCLDSHINTILSEWLITMYYTSKCTAAVWLMPHRKWSRSGVFVGVWCGRVWGVGM